MIDQLSTGVPQAAQSANTASRDRKQSAADKDDKADTFEDVVSKAGQQQTGQGSDKDAQVGRRLRADAKESASDLRPKAAFELSVALHGFGNIVPAQGQTQGQSQVKVAVKNGAKPADQTGQQSEADAAKLREKLKHASQQAERSSRRNQAAGGDMQTEADEALTPSDELSLLLGLTSAKETDVKHEKKAAAGKKTEDKDDDEQDVRLDKLASKHDMAHADQVAAAVDSKRSGDTPASDGKSSQSDAVRLVSANGRGRSVDIEVPSVAGETQRDTAKAAAPKLDTATVLEARRYLGFSPEPNATALATAIKADPTWAEALQAAQGPDLGTLGKTASEVNTLKLQMNPENLGNMVASLKLKGEELTVELRVDSVEAYQQLSADHDDIVKALQDQGFSIDKVTVQLNATDRTDTGADRDMARQGQSQRDAETQQRDGQGNRSGRDDARRDQGRWTPSGAMADNSAGDGRGDIGRAGNIYL
jgi:chemotaxis protein MotD